MKIEIVVGEEHNYTRIQAKGSESTDPLPLLRAAIEALQWEIDNYSKCPVHQKLELRQYGYDWMKDSEFSDIIIMDADGFRDGSYNTLMTRSEFNQKLMQCTIRIKC